MCVARRQELGPQDVQRHAHHLAHGHRRRCEGLADLGVRRWAARRQREASTAELAQR